MEFCSVVLRQLDDHTAEIRTVINTDVLMVLFRKKQSTTEFYDNLKLEIIRQLGIEFGIDFDDPFSESVSDIQQRTHKGITNQGHSFVSVLSIVKVGSQGGGLTEDLSSAIINIIKEAVREEAPPLLTREEVIDVLTSIRENSTVHSSSDVVLNLYDRAIQRAIELLRV